MNTQALIVAVNIRKPGQTEMDEDITKELQPAHDMVDGAGRYTRFLYARDPFKDVTAVDEADKSVLVAFQNRYAQCADDGPIAELLGERAARYFRQKFEMKITRRRAHPPSRR